MKGNPTTDYPNQQVPYIKINDSGNMLDMYGNRLEFKNINNGKYIDPNGILHEGIRHGVTEVRDIHGKFIKIIKDLKPSELSEVHISFKEWIKWTKWNKK